MISDKFPNKHGTFVLIRISVYIAYNHLGFLLNEMVKISPILKLQLTHNLSNTPLFFNN